MDTNKWKSVAIRKEIVELAADIGEKTERPTSNVFAYGIKRLKKISTKVACTKYPRCKHET